MCVCQRCSAFQDCCYCLHPWLLHMHFRIRIQGKHKSLLEFYGLMAISWLAQLSKAQSGFTSLYMHSLKKKKSWSIILQYFITCISPAGIFVGDLQINLWRIKILPSLNLLICECNVSICLEILKTSSIFLPLFNSQILSVAYSADITAKRSYGILKVVH